MTSLPRTLSILALVALGSGCAAGHKSSAAPMGAYDAMPAEAAMMEDMAAPMDEVVPMAESAAAPTTVGTAATPAEVAAVAHGVLGMAPTGSTEGPAQEAVANDGSDPDLSTIGADSVDRMIIFTGTMGLTVDYDTGPAVMDTAIDQAVAAGGYVALQTDTQLTLRVPSKRFRAVMRGVAGLGEVTTRSVNTVDVSEEFHDLKIELDNLEATRARIQKLLDQAKGLDEILRVEKELQRISAQIDTLEGRMRFLGSRAAFSTITVTVSERAPVVLAEPDVEEVEPPPPPPPPPPRLLDTSVDWIDEVGVDRLMRLP